MRNLLGLFMAAFAFTGLSMPITADAQDVLYCRDGNLGTDAMDAALMDFTAMSPMATVTRNLDDTSLTACETALAGTTFDLVIVAVQNNGPYTTPNFDAHVMGGGRTIFTEWNQDAANAAMFGATYTTETNTTTLTVVAPFDAGLTANPITLMNPGWGTYTMTLAPTGGATSIARLGTGAGAVRSASGRTIINGMLFDTGGADLQRFFLNEIRALLGPDADGDGVDAPADCDDFDATVFPGAPDMVCDGVDNDCNGTADDGFMSTATTCGVGACEGTGMTTCMAGVEGDTCVAGAPAPDDATCDGVDDDCDGDVDEGVTGAVCALTEGVCAGASERCVDGALACEGYGEDYEEEESACDGLDNDCDGTTDEGCPCEDGATQACGRDVGACERGVQTCTGGTWGLCEGEIGPMGESCNGVDDDCDGTEDEPAELSPPDCPLQLGVCVGSRRRCGGASGFLACAGTESYGGDYQVSESLCDGLDNDCDGVTDEGCMCVDGTSQPCGSDVGACRSGTQTCAGGVYGACAGEVAPAVETCDGVD
ncbi:MAG TPA: hypothetical protein DEF51_12260, partial [Myxococcales bacterium]|nr:hypothetical protein [Myxococcales bacterium]